MSFIEASGIVFRVSAESPSRITKVAFGSNLFRRVRFTEEGKSGLGGTCSHLLSE